MLITTHQHVRDRRIQCVKNDASNHIYWHDRQHIVIRHGGTASTEDIWGDGPKQTILVQIPTKKTSR